MLLSALGVYGVLAFAISRRTHEIGIRIALGARPATLMRLVLGEGLRLTGIGTGFGVLASLALIRSFASVIVPLESANPTIFGSAALLLLLVGGVASYVPAKRALQIHPADALRHE
jgi:putative ABC transport system permease protein